MARFLPPISLALGVAGALLWWHVATPQAAPEGQCQKQICAEIWQLWPD